jgi:hypothetical protein
MVKNNKNNTLKNQRIPKISGQGNYFTDTMSSLIPKGTFARLGGKGGGFLGGQVAGRLDPLLMQGGSKLGGRFGRSMGEKIANLVGFGDYAVVSNTLSTVGKAIQPGEPVPQFGTNGASTRIRHREYITDIVVPSNPTAFANVTYAVNPGNAVLFPWLAGIANGYQQYKFHGLIFEFVSTTSEVSSGGPMGSIIMASDYDVVDLPFSTKQAMENSQFAVSAKPSCSQIHTMECDPAMTASTLLYTSSNTTNNVSDPRWCNLANFQIATQGLPGSSGQVLGELWASYDVELAKPELPPVGSLGLQTVSGVSPSAGNWLGSSPTSTGTTYFTATINTFVCIVPGTYFVEFAAAGTSPSALTNSGTASFTTLVVAQPVASITTFSQSAIVVVSTGSTLIVSTAGWSTQTSSVTRFAKIA